MCVYVCDVHVYIYIYIHTYIHNTYINMYAQTSQPERSLGIDSPKHLPRNNGGESSGAPILSISTNPKYKS